MFRIYGIEYVISCEFIIKQQEARNLNVQSLCEMYDEQMHNTR